MNVMTTFPNTFLYSISWEDARVDKPVLDVQPTDKVLTLTGGGDNVFNLVLDGAERVDCVDINPAQYHLMELKLKALQHGSYAELWSLFGEGIMPRFETFLMHKCKPHITDDTLEFWFDRRHYFRSPGIYFRGAMGRVVRVVHACGLRFIFSNPWLDRSGVFYMMCLYLGKMMIWMFCTLFANTSIMWKLFGTPPKQLDMITSTHSVARYAATAVPVVFEKTDVYAENHHYFLIMNGRFSKNNCPDYLQYNNFQFLKGCVASRVRNMNTSLLDMLDKEKYNKLILMDHMDWMDEEYVTRVCQGLREGMCEDGVTIFRSAGLHPWYVRVFEEHGFRLTNISNHVDNPLMDRVNMYASFWKIEHNIG